ncbi:MAG: ABC transporter permease [Candidatus Sericytochromatia bacterium]|nr:ABC transporter permease [Candidatus Tanganyikabacteria bacterium]
MYLYRKLLRDLWRGRGQAVALALVLLLGIAMFVASASSYRNLSASYDKVQRGLGLADLHVTLTGGDAADVRHVAGLAGIQAAEGRMVVGLPLRLTSRASASPDGVARLEGRLISLPGPRAQPRFDRLHMVRGGLPGPGEVVVEQHLAAFHRTEPGDTITVDLPGARGHALRVSGIALSAEYLWVTRDNNDPMPTPDQFGVLWAGRADMAAIARRVGAVILWAPAGKLLLAGDLMPAARPEAITQIMVEPRPGASASEVAAAIRDALGADRVLDVVAREDIPAMRMLQMDLDGLRGMALFFPALFLAAAIFMAAAAQARFVDAQRATIGTLLALGMPRRRVLSHYLLQALLPGGAGTVLGVLAGVAGADGMTRMYAAEIGLPQVAVLDHPGIAAIGLAGGFLAAACAGWGPARRAAGLPPAQAMRRPPPLLPAGLLLARRFAGNLGTGPALAVRGLFRRPVRNFLTAGGIAAAVVLVVGTGAMFDSMTAALGDQIDRTLRFDIQADLMIPRGAEALAAEVRAEPGVADAQFGLSLPVELQAAGTRSVAFFTALEGPPRLFQPRDTTGRLVMPAAGEVLLGRPLARRFGLREGDRGAPVRVRRLPDGRTVAMRFGGIYEAPGGGFFQMRYEDAAAGFGLAGKANTILARCARADCAGARKHLRALPNLIRVYDLASFRELLKTYMKLGFAMVGMLVGFAAVLAGAILYNTVTMSILERLREVATLRALGMPMRRIAALFTLEHGVLAALGLAAGLPLGGYVAGRVLSMYDSDLFSLPLVIHPRTFGLAVAGVLLVLAIGQWPALRAVARQNVAEAVREREG